MSFKRKQKSESKSSRINLIIAIVFLFGLAMIYKLYDLQIAKYDFYSDLASSQHEVFSKLEASRGKIFLSDGADNSGRYPVATNKEFALVYVVPRDILKSRANEIAQNFYIVFNEEEVKEEVEILLEEEYNARLEKDLTFIASLGLNEEEQATKEEELKKKHKLFRNDKEYLDWRETRKEAEIKIRKEKIIENYLIKLRKEDDPYEPIEKKVDEDDLLKLYALLLSSESKKVLPENLDIKNGDIVRINDDGDNEIVKIDGIAHVMNTYRYYPEGNVGSHVLGFVSNNGGKEGEYGLEGFFNEELSGTNGFVKIERGADRDVLIVNDREYDAPVSGDDLILTINRSIQFTVCKKLNEAGLRHGADGGSVIIVKPETGEIIAMCSWPDFDPNNYDEVEDIRTYNNKAIFSAYEPGSVFKTITMAAAIDQNKVTPDTKYTDEGEIMIAGWPKPIKNSDFSTRGAHGLVSMNKVLEESLNTGAIFAMRQIGGQKFIDYVKNFGFKDKTGIELATEGPSDIRNLLTDKVPEIYTATASFGQGITTTPLQLVMAYGAIANGGILMKPYVVKEIVHADGSVEITKPRQIRRVISERASALVSGMLVNVVDNGHAKLAGVNGYYVGGKTGTAQIASTEVRGYSGRTAHTFIGFAPIDDPVFVMLVKLDDPKDVVYSASSAAPLFGEIAEFLLQYYEVPKERK